MDTVFGQAMRRWRWQIVGWGGSLLVLAVYLMWLYQPMLEQQAQVRALFDAYGEEMLAFFGGTADIFSASGYLDFGFFSYIPVAVGILALVLGSGLVAADEEKGTLDLILAHPVSRTALFWGRWLALLAVLAGTLLLTWAGFALGQPLAELEATAWQMLLPHASLLSVLMLFGTLALLLSLVLPSRAAAASVTAGLLVASYIVDSLAAINDQLAAINNLSPLKYYQGGSALDGLNWGYWLGTMSVTLALAVLAWLVFLRRDIRVSGEGAGLQWGNWARREGIHER
jgi:ABC-2 type transport system permease protein